MIFIFIYFFKTKFVLQNLSIGTNGVPVGERVTGEF